MFLRVIAILMFFTCSLFAQGPEEITEEYFQLLEDQKWEEIASLFDENALSDFRGMLQFLFENDSLPALAQVRSQFFGPSITSAQVNEMTDQIFFSKFLGGIFQQAAQLGSLNFTKLEILGSVKEGKDTVHVVTRNVVGFGEMEMENMEIVSFKKVETQWKILLSGKIKGFAQQLSKMLNK